MQVMKTFYITLGIAVVIAIAVHNRTQEPTPAAATQVQTTVQAKAPEYNCDNHRIVIISADELRLKYGKKIISDALDGKARNSEDTKYNRSMVDFMFRRELKEGDEYLEHGCTEQVDQIRAAITDLHKIEDE